MIHKLACLFLVLSFVAMLRQVEGCLWGSGCHKRDCSLSSWSKWSSCSQPCGTEGLQIRFRRVTRAPKCGGSCGSLTQTRQCNRECPNGGTPNHLWCNCKAGYSGRCCTGGKQYYSFIRPSTHSFDARKSCICFSQLTVVGQIGVLGIPVMRPVELVSKSVFETAHSQHLKMAGNFARERGSKDSCVNYHPAPVSKKQAVT